MRRAARLLLALITAIGVLMLFVFPARTLLDQRHEIAASQRSITALSRENSQLAARNKAAWDPAQVEQTAHQDYGMVMPGQQAYTIIPSTAPKHHAAKKAKSRADREKKARH